MAIATRVDSFIVPTWTQATLYTAIKTAFTNAGYAAPVSDFTSGTDLIAVYAVTLDGAKTYGTAYLRVRLTNAFVIGLQVFATWNSTTNTGTGNSTEITYTALNAAQQVNFVSLDAGNELKLILAFQGTNAIFLGFIAPVNKPAWWDLNTWNYCFVPTANTFALLRSSTLNPYTNTENDTSLNNARMGTANSVSSRRDILPGIILFNQSNAGIAGRTSDDLIMCAGSGTTRLDTLQVPGDTKQYLVLNPASGGLAVRIT